MKNNDIDQHEKISKMNITRDRYLSGRYPNIIDTIEDIKDVKDVDYDRILYRIRYESDRDQIAIILMEGFLGDDSDR